MGVALWPVAGRATACVAQRHYCTDPRDPPLKSRPVVVLPPHRNLGSHGRGTGRRGSGKAPRRSARAEQHQDDAMTLQGLPTAQHRRRVKGCELCLRGRCRICVVLSSRSQDEQDD
eukprot:scaffold35077_cov47-Phaeocystis_antarctica.AAC.1